MTMQLERLLTPRECCQLLHISERTLWGMSKRGEIPCLRFGKAVRYDPVDLRVWLDGQKQAGREREA